MDPFLISESILRSIEERRRRRKDFEPVTSSPAAPAKIGEPAVKACGAELDKTIRSSILSSFTHWEVSLVPELEGIVRRSPRGAGAAGPAPGAVSPGVGPRPPARATGKAGAAARSGVSSRAPALRDGEPLPAVPTLEEGGLAPSTAPDSDSGGNDSWGRLADAVRELRQEWDQESFDGLFPAPESIPDPGAPPPAPAPAPFAVAPPAAATPAAPAQGNREDLIQKLDELIRLVKNSVDDRSPPRSQVSGEIPGQIALEVAGRLRETLAGLKPGEEGPAPAPRERNPVERIPMNDVASVIDQITGSAPQ